MSQYRQTYLCRANQDACFFLLMAERIERANGYLKLDICLFWISFVISLNVYCVKIDSCEKSVAVFLVTCLKGHVCVCSIHVFCLVTGSEEELNPVLMALKRSADRKMPSKSLEDIPSATSSEHKACVCLP